MADIPDQVVAEAIRNAIELFQRIVFKEFEVSHPACFPCAKE
jgi:hypothetical protein